VQLVTYRLRDHAAKDRVGAWVGRQVIDLHDACAALGPGEDALPSLPGSLLEILRAEHGMETVRRAVAHAMEECIPRLTLDDIRFSAPLPRPNSIRDFMLVEEHVLNSFGEVPPEWYEIPVYWKGNCDAVFGPEDVVPWPSYTDQLDFELEVAAVIGKETFRVSIDEAADSIAGYTIFNDWSARDIQFREMKVGLGPGLGKDFATSIGPCLVTVDSFDVATARMAARVNGELWSEGTLGRMRFSFPEVVAHLSQEQRLMPGDVLGSGTVARGCGLELGRWIRPGDVVELEVEGIGVLRNVIGGKHASHESSARTADLVRAGTNTAS
jgi:2-keto-4-pentenoate hydratase/2-oxohepta-3-ene-1,7-dioic acid hydratase in catechol pathway